jgi:hypothetical protein
MVASAAEEGDMGMRLTALLGVVWVLVAACGKQQHDMAADQRQQPLDPELQPLVQLLQQQHQQIPTPPVLPGNIDSVSDTTIVAYIRKLSFVSDTEAGDRQGLLVGHYPGSAHYGPVATILPEINSNRGSLAELRLRGKVIARIQMDSIGAQPYPKLGLLPGATTYWWVQLNSGDTSAMGRSVFITVDARGRIISRTSSPLTVRQYHPFYRNLQPLARFTWNPGDEGTWGTCNGACCAKN